MSQETYWEVNHSGTWLLRGEAALSAAVNRALERYDTRIIVMADCAMCHERKPLPHTPPQGLEGNWPQRAEHSPILKTFFRYALKRELELLALQLGVEP